MQARLSCANGIGLQDADVRDKQSAFSLRPFRQRRPARRRLVCLSADAPDHRVCAVTPTGDEICEWLCPSRFIPAATQLLGSIFRRKKPSAVTSIGWSETKCIKMTIINPPFLFSAAIQKKEII